MFNNTEPYNDLPLLPPKADIETKNILKKAITANKAITELKNKANFLPNQNILLSTIALREAKDSSAIENIFTTNDRLYKAAITPEQLLDPATKEVKKYNEALWFGYKYMQSRPMNTNLFVSLMQIIKGNESEIRNLPGTVLSNKQHEVIYTPPEGENLIREKLKNLEDFLYDEKNADIDPLIKMAILHYQFESIHPFTDGNGRTGRLINILYLVQEKLLDNPILFLSKYFLDNRAGYYEGLRDVTYNENWEQWILYMLDAVEKTSLQTIKVVEDIKEAMRFYKYEIKNHFPSIYAHELIETLFEKPYFRLENILEKGLIKSRQTATKHLKQLAEAYIEDGKRIQLIEVNKIGRENIYINKSLYNILNSHSL